MIQGTELISTSSPQADSVSVSGPLICARAVYPGRVARLLQDYATRPPA